MACTLVSVNGSQPGESLTLDEKIGEFSLGRDPARDIQVADDTASRLHARLSYDGHAWRLEDCGSRNGTTVNSVPVERVILKGGDIIHIGEQLFVFVEDEDLPSSSAWQSATAACGNSISQKVDVSSLSLSAQSRKGEDSGAIIEKLSILCRFSMNLHTSVDTHSLCMSAQTTLEEAFPQASTRVWLKKVDGRLHAISVVNDCEGESLTQPFFANLAIEQQQALLVDAAATEETADGELAPLARMAAPIPVNNSWPGAIVCVAKMGDDFQESDLKFLASISMQLGMAIESIEHRSKLENANDQLRQRLSQNSRILGESKVIEDLHGKIIQVAPTNSTVLIHGESGTGKELVARTLHDLSHRAAGPFVALNCAAFPESLLESELFGHEAGAFTGADRRRLGRFEQADQGTIFLDEIGEMSLACQAKLLRLLEGHPFERLGGQESICADVRIVSATHRSLSKRISEGTFREDLYYRLRVIELEIPPLRSRGNDIILIAGHFLDDFRQQLGRGPTRFSSEAIATLLSYNWPGNVRELRNAVERALVLGNQEEVVMGDLGLQPLSGEAPTRQLISLAELERQHIEFVLQAVEGNKTEACKILGIGRGTLYKKLA